MPPRTPLILSVPNSTEGALSELCSDYWISNQSCVSSMSPFDYNQVAVIIIHSHGAGFIDQAVHLNWKLQ